MSLEGARARIRSNEPEKLEMALKVIPLEEMFEPIESAETKPTILHQVVHSAVSIEDFNALITVILRVVYEKKPELRTDAHPLARWLNSMDGHGLTPIHKAVFLQPHKPNRDPLHCRHVIARLVELGAVLWMRSAENRTAFEYFLDIYQEDDPSSRSLLDYFLAEVDSAQSGLMEAELTRILKSCARNGYHTPLSALLPLCPQAAEECFNVSCQEGRLGCVDALLSCTDMLPGAKLTRKVITEGMQEACKHNRKKIVKRLINEADINHPSAQGWGCLQLACASGHAKIVSFLVSHNAKVIATPSSPHPLHLAARNGHISVLTLLAAALPGDVPDVDGRTALHYAAAAMCIPPEPGIEWRAAEVLLLRSLNTFDDEGLTPLAYSLRRWAEQEGGKPNPEALLCTVRFLINKGANVDIKGDSRRFGISISGALSATEIAQERCVTLGPEVIVQIWKASRPAAPPVVVPQSPAPVLRNLYNGKEQKRAYCGEQDLPSQPETKRIGISPPPPSPSGAAPVLSSLRSSNVAASLKKFGGGGIALPVPTAGGDTLRFIEVIKDETGAMIYPPEFLVTGSSDGIPHMPLVSVPASHRFSAIALAVREGKLNDSQRKKLYEVWSLANQM